MKDRLQYKGKQSKAVREMGRQKQALRVLVQHAKENGYTLEQIRDLINMGLLR